MHVVGDLTDVHKMCSRPAGSGPDREDLPPFSGAWYGSRCTRRSPPKNGMTLIELIVVIAILALSGAVAVPPLLDWRHGMRLRAAANEIRNDLELARARAVKENTDVVVQFDPPGGHYQVTYTDDAGNLVRVKTHSLPVGIRIATENPAYTFGHQAVFGSRGTARSGTLVLANSKGATRQIVVNFLGRVDLRN